MKTRREIIRSTGLTTVYEPDVPSDEPGLDIIFVHGIGGHPVKTWLYSPSSTDSLAHGKVITAKATSTGSSGTHVGKPSPNRSRSLRSWVSSASTLKTDRKLVKKSQCPPAHRQQQQQSCEAEDSDIVTPWRPHSLRSGSVAGRDRAEDECSSLALEKEATMVTAAAISAEILQERLIFRSMQASPMTATKKRSSPGTTKEVLRSDQGSHITATANPNLTSTMLLMASAGGKRRHSTKQLVQETQIASSEETRYWPQDLLPTSCPNARILTWGFRTIVTHEYGYLVPGQFDIFARGRQLLESLDELGRGSATSPRSSVSASRRTRRDVVFVVHSTGGIVVKEMLRMASSFSDTHNEDLLASIAGIVFLGCPLQESANHGSLVDAMRSMAGHVTGVSSNDEVLRELLGGSEDEHLAGLGRESFDVLRYEYDFPIKCYRETKIVGPLNDWTKRDLALRRGASWLVDHMPDAEDMDSDHVGLAKFSSADNESYQSIASFIARLAHDQSLKARPLTDRETFAASALFVPSSIASEPETQQQKTRKSPLIRRVIPHWLLTHSHTQLWLRRSGQNSVGVAAVPNKVLWLLSGPTGSARPDLLASLRHHVQTRWAPETHSSLIISIKAGQNHSSVKSVPLIGDSSIQNHYTGADGNRQKSRAASAPADAAAGDRTTTNNNTGRAASVNEALRSLLSQLYVHDARLRRLVWKCGAQTATAGSLYHGEIFETPPCQSRDPDEKLHATAAETNSSSLTADSRSASQDEANWISHLSTADTPGQIAASRHCSDPIGNPSDRLTDVQVGLVGQEGQAGKTIGRQAILDDAYILDLFLDEYLGIDWTAQQQSYEASIANLGSPISYHSGVNAKTNHKKIRIPGVRRVFVLVDAVEISDKQSAQELLWYLGLLAQRSDFSICVGTMELDLIDWSELNGSKWQRPLSDSLLPVVIPENNIEEIRQYIGEHLVLDMEEREAISAKIADRAIGLQLWAKMVVDIVNEASEEGVSGEVIRSMLDDITPAKLCTAQSKFNALYSWKLSRMSRTEMSQALVMMQWVMLSPQPLRLNELLVAMRLTMLSWPRAGLAGWDMKKTLDVEPAMSLKDLRKSTSGERGITMDSPLLFWRWIQSISRGLLRLESAGTGDKISSEPLALQHVLPVDESVRDYFVQGPGFQTLLSMSGNSWDRTVSMESFMDSSYCNMLHACLLYLNMSDLESLGRGAKPLRPMPDDLPFQEKAKWRKNAEDQRRMVMSSYPFLRYVVDNLVFYLLCPRAYRYFLPQKDLLRLFTANRCRIWRRWTHLQGFSIADSDPKAILDRASQGAAKSVLDPVYGANYRLERVLRKVWRTAMDQQLMGIPRSAATSPRMHLRSRSELSERSVVFTLVGSNDPEKAQWLVPTRSRSRSASSPAAPNNINSHPRSPRSPMTMTPLSPRYLTGIKELT